MLPYQTVAMDYGVSAAAVAASFGARHHHNNVIGHHHHHHHNDNVTDGQISPSHHHIGLGGMSPTSTALTHHHLRGDSASNSLAMGPNINSAAAVHAAAAASAAAFTHSWFVPAELCGISTFKQNNHTSVLEPGILEVRKEKSRDAARVRRGKENFEFYELAKMLPLPAAITSQLDKASIIRLTISYLKLRDFSSHGDPPWTRDTPPIHKTLKGIQPRSRNISIILEMFEQHQGTHILQSLDGFALALAADGRFLYISETVSIYLGLSQVEMTGSSIFDYVHHADHNELAEQLGLGLSQGQNTSSPNSATSEEGSSNAGTNNPDVSSIMSLQSTSNFKGLDRAFCIRMKSTLTKRGCHFKSSGYRVVLLLCRLRPQYTFAHSRKTQPPLLGMVALAIALPPPSVHEIRLDSDMFVTRINFDFKIAHCEPRVSELLDYSAEELTGKNLYSLCHGEDAHKLRKCHVDLICKGQVLTHYYRLMNKNGGYTWLQTCATVVCNSKNADEQNIICVNYIVSGIECENLILDCSQLETKTRIVKNEDRNGHEPENHSPGADPSDGQNGHDTPETQQPPPPPPPPRPHHPSHSPNHKEDAHHDHEIGTNYERPLNGHDLSVNRRYKDDFEAKVAKRRHTHMEPSSGAASDNDDDDDSIHAPKRRISSSSSASSIHSGGSCKAIMSPASSTCQSGMAAEPVRVDADADALGTSVKDLENAMSKHLPNNDKTANASTYAPSDFSADSLLKQQQRTTIQWIGMHHHHFNHHLQHQPLTRDSSNVTASPTPLPATALLRQLYANRESVIRANIAGVRPNCAPSWNDHQVAGTLPTPPSNNDAKFDGSSSYPMPLTSASTTTDTFPSLISSTLSNAVMAGSGSYTIDYHTATMTPPSSVSPRDKHQQVHGCVTIDTPAYSDLLRQQYANSAIGGDVVPQPLPLKPQVYSAMHPGLDAGGYPSFEQQFYHHNGAGAAGSFHNLYHSAINKGPPAPWYSTT